MTGTIDLRKRLAAHLETYGYLPGIVEIVVSHFPHDDELLQKEFNHAITSLQRIAAMPASETREAGLTRNERKFLNTFKGDVK